MSLKISSINVKGYRQKFKRDIIWSRLVQLNFDIVFMQETHVTNLGEAKKFSKDFDGKCYWSFGSTRARGVGIMLSSTLDYKYINNTYDFEGRVACVDIDIGASKLRLINVYCPNNEVDRKEFLSNLQAYLVTSREIILGGDFNFVENPQLDKMGGNLERGTIGHKEIELLKKDFYLVDAFRRKYPKRKEYSFRIGPVHCRLDRFYISDTLIQWVNKINHTPSSCSDHYYVDMEFKSFDLEKMQYGPGFWKCNTKVLDDVTFKNDMEKLWNDKLNKAPIKDAQWWENCKVQFKKLIILHSRKISSQLRKQIKNLEKDLRLFVQLATHADDKHRYNIFVEQIKSELNDLIGHQLQGVMVRTRVRTLDEYEKPTRFFLRIEHKNAKAKNIKQIQVDNKMITQPNEIIQEVRKFYTNLYKENPVDQNMINLFLHNVNLPRLEPDLVEHCEGNLSFGEAEVAIAAMKNGKTPGLDGLPAEFYKKYFYLIGHEFINMINLCFLMGLLTPSQRKGLITLLCKDYKFHYLLTNWRPISLLCVDYKIVTKCLSLRLKKVLPFIVHPDQTCSIEGRSIADNVHLLRNCFDFVEQKNLKCAFLNLDQAKAFDRVSITYLLQTLVHSALVHRSSSGSD